MIFFKLAHNRLSFLIKIKSSITTMKNFNAARFLTSPLRPISLILISLILLNGCTQKYKDMTDTLHEGFFGFDDVTMDTSQIKNIPYASSYVRIDDGSRILMILAFAERNPQNKHLQLKWVSSDGAMIVTESGKIVKTLNLPAINLERREFSEWHWKNNFDILNKYDWIEHSKLSTHNSFHYSFKSLSKLTKLNVVHVKSPSWQKDLTIWQELITFNKIKESVRNLYWVDKKGQVFKSEQFIGPQMTKISMEILKPFQGVTN